MSENLKKIHERTLAENVKQLEQILEQIEVVDSLLKEASVVEPSIVKSLSELRETVRAELKEQVWKQYLEAE